MRLKLERTSTSVTPEDIVRSSYIVARDRQLRRSWELAGIKNGKEGDDRNVHQLWIDFDSTDAEQQRQVCELIGLVESLKGKLAAEGENLKNDLMEANQQRHKAEQFRQHVRRSIILQQKMEQAEIQTKPPVDVN